nr:MAG TPA: hypothetical protein [Caudoviricetes sp.]
MPSAVTAPSGLASSAILSAGIANTADWLAVVGRKPSGMLSDTCM